MRQTSWTTSTTLKGSSRTRSTHSRRSSRTRRRLRDQKTIDQSRDWGRGALRAYITNSKMSTCLWSSRFQGRLLRQQSWSEENLPTKWCVDQVNLVSPTSSEDLRAGIPERIPRWMDARRRRPHRQAARCPSDCTSWPSLTSNFQQCLQIHSKTWKSTTTSS